MFQKGMWRCFKQSTLEVFHKMTKANVIPFGEYVRFVRQENVRKLSLMNSDYKMDKNILEKSSLSLESWSEYILEGILNLFKTHTLFIGKSPNEGCARNILFPLRLQPIFETVVGRRRHRQNQMVPMMLLGLTSFGVFSVPMGFQFLLIVCGKAVLFAKMALLISSINGSTRVE